MCLGFGPFGEKRAREALKKEAVLFFVVLKSSLETKEKRRELKLESLLSVPLAP